MMGMTTMNMTISTSSFQAHVVKVKPRQPTGKRPGGNDCPPRGNT